MEIPEELKEHKQYSFEVYFRNVLINKLLPYETITKAVAGDTEAVSAVIKHFSGLIYKLSLVPVIRADGSYQLKFDEDIMRELEIELIMRLPNFDPVNG